MGEAGCVSGRNHHGQFGRYVPFLAFALQLVRADLSRLAASKRRERLRWSTDLSPAVPQCGSRVRTALLLGAHTPIVSTSCAQTGATPRSYRLLQYYGYGYFPPAPARLSPVSRTHTPRRDLASPGSSGQVSSYVLPGPEDTAHLVVGDVWRVGRGASCTRTPSPAFGVSCPEQRCSHQRQAHSWKRVSGTYIPYRGGVVLN